VTCRASGALRGSGHPHLKHPHPLPLPEGEGERSSHHAAATAATAATAIKGSAPVAQRLRSSCTGGGRRLSLVCDLFQARPTRASGPPSGRPRVFGLEPPRPSLGRDWAARESPSLA
jgi:hypothetical protein